MSLMWARPQPSGLTEAEVARRRERRRARQRAICDAIDRFWDEHGRGPSRVELGMRVGLREDSLRRHLSELKDAGRVTWDPAVRYSLRTR